jgi:hypothetical protein
MIRISYHVLTLNYTAKPGLLLRLHVHYSMHGTRTCAQLRVDIRYRIDADARSSGRCIPMHAASAAVMRNYVGPQDNW